MTRILFLPGSGASPDFWKPVGTRLPQAWPKEYFGWPGLGDQPHDPAIRGMDDLVGLVAAKMDEPVDLVAQSMGGVVAALVAVAHPELVRRLVLTATSAGIDLAPYSPEDWRPEYAQEYPGAASWILTERPDLAGRLPGVTAPTLLLWSDADPISPLGVGRRLAQLLPQAELVVIPGVDHMFARDHPEPVAPHVLRHLAAG
jgi:pimeloyl-ACP methyl ester carboxylesterase